MTNESHYHSTLKECKVFPVIPTGTIFSMVALNDLKIHMKLNFMGNFHMG